jgi:methyl-accepting chemotaxis protein
VVADEVRRLAQRTLESSALAMQHMDLGEVQQQVAALVSASDAKLALIDRLGIRLGDMAQLFDALGSNMQALSDTNRLVTEAAPQVAQRAALLLGHAERAARVANSLAEALPQPGRPGRQGAGGGQ